MLVLCILQVSFLLVWFLSATKVIAIAIAAWTKHNMLQQHQQPGQLLGIVPAATYAAAPKICS